MTMNIVHKETQVNFFSGRLVNRFFYRYKDKKTGEMTVVMGENAKDGEDMNVICQACGFETGSDQKECPRCGLIFSRYRKRTTDTAPTGGGMEHRGGVEESGEEDPPFLSSLLFYVKPQVDSPDFVFRLAFAVVLGLWGLVLMVTARDGDGGGFGFWHLVNLPFHEAGHVILRPFGHFLMSLGGTLGQLAMPLVCMGVFLVKTRDTFAAGFCLWWLGVNFLDMAPYIGDARSLSLPLLGGNVGSSSPYGFHDWEYLLTETGLLAWDKALSNLSFFTGVVLMIGACLWWVVVLVKYRERMMA